MSKNNLIEFKAPEVKIEDELTAIAREGARKMLQAALEAEIEEHLSAHSHLRTHEGRQRVVRNGHLPSRSVTTGIGPVELSVPRARDNQRDGRGIKFTSELLPPWAKRTVTVETAIPVLYLLGVSTGDMDQALSALMGESAAGISPGVVCRLKEAWEKEREEWSRRSLSGKRYAYFWADAIHCSARMEERVLLQQI